LNKIVILLFFLSTFFTFSQDEESELWAKMSFKEKINKNLFFSLEPGSRYNFDNFFFTKQFSDLSIEAQILKSKIGTISIEIGGRLTKIPNQRTLGKRQYFTTNYTKKINKINLSLRSRLFFEQNVVNYYKKYFRNKLTIQYTQSKLIRPFLDGEYLSGLNSNNVDKMRFSIGNSFKISKKRTLKIFYRLQNTIEDNVNKKRIFGIYISQKL
tara:strand:- start:47 stop:682 length:636 start_codon:yes stop_codon:yes gene_type:complete